MILAPAARAGAEEAPPAGEAAASRPASSSSSPAPHCERRGASVDSAAAHRRPRAPRTTSPLVRDEFASTRHARIEPRRDGVWVEDVGSTNGTFVNGVLADGAAQARARRRDPHRRDRPPLRAMTLDRAVCGLTDTGRRRRHNEDAYVCDPPLFAIADGMGGAQAGEIASHLAATSVAARRPRGPGRRRARRAADPGSEPERLRARADGRVHLRHGHDDDGRARRRRHRPHRPRRRLARLPRPRPHARAADRGPLARRRARPLGPSVRRGGRGAPAPIGDHARPRHRPRGRGRRVLDRPRGRATCSCSAPTGSPSMVDDDAILELLEENRRDVTRARRR